MTAREDFQRDAANLIAYKQMLDHRSDVDDDPAQEDEVHLLRDIEENNRWVGYYVTETNAEKIYEVSYPYAVKKFYLTEYVMRECVSFDPDEIFYSE